MAQIKSMAIGDARKSIGNITYRYVGGQTIASQKITQNNSRTPGQIRQRRAMTEMSHLAKTLDPVIRYGFKHEGGRTARNFFTHFNKPYMAYIKEHDEIDSSLPPISNLCIAMADPLFRQKIYAGNGTIRAINEFRWSGDKNLEGTINLTRPFQAGDEIVIAAMYSYRRLDEPFERVKLFNHIVEPPDIIRLEQPDQYVVNPLTIPGLDILGSLPPDAEYLEILVTALVKGAKDHTTSEIRPMPDMLYHYDISAEERADDDTYNIKVTDAARFSSEIGEDARNSTLIVNYGPEKGKINYPSNPLTASGSGDITGITLQPPPGYKFVDAMEMNTYGDAILVINGSQTAALSITFLPGIEKKNG